MKRKNNKKGYSLLEVLISFVVLSIALQVMVMGSGIVQKETQQRHDRQPVQQIGERIETSLIRSREKLKTFTKGQAITLGDWIGEEVQVPEGILLVYVVVEEKEWLLYKDKPNQLQTKVYCLTNEPPALGTLKQEDWIQMLGAYKVNVVNTVSAPVDYYRGVSLTYKKGSDGLYTVISQQAFLL